MIKPGVDVRGLKPEMVLAYNIACEVFGRYSKQAIITCGLDGKHMPGSKHYTGEALDLRTRHLDMRLRPVLAEDYSKALGPQYDVVLEDNPPHIHVELDIK